MQIELGSQLDDLVAFDPLPGRSYRVHIMSYSTKSGKVIPYAESFRLHYHWDESTGDGLRTFHCLSGESEEHDTSCCTTPLFNTYSKTLCLILVYAVTKDGEANLSVEPDIRLLSLNAKNYASLATLVKARPAATSDYFVTAQVKGKFTNYVWDFAGLAAEKGFGEDKVNEWREFVAEIKNAKSFYHYSGKTVTEAQVRQAICADEGVPYEDEDGLAGPEIATSTEAQEALEDL